MQQQKMTTITISERVENWVHVIAALSSIPLFRFIYTKFKKRQRDRKALCYRIGEKYYRGIELTKCLRAEANKVTIDNIEPLKTVNSLLMHFNHFVLSVPNDNSPNDIELSEIRAVFSNQAANCVIELNRLFEEMDKEGKERNAWGAVCSQHVVACADAILRNWFKLMEIMAAKRHMAAETLHRDFEEKSAGL